MNKITTNFLPLPILFSYLSVCFFIGKWEKHVLKAPKGGIAKYTQSIQKKRLVALKERNKKLIPYFKLNQSIKSNNDKVWSFIYTLAQISKAYKKQI